MNQSNSSKEAQAKAEASFKRKADQARDGKLAAAEYEAAGRAMREKTAKLREAAPRQRGGRTGSGSGESEARAEGEGRPEGEGRAGG